MLVFPTFTTVQFPLPLLSLLHHYKIESSVFHDWTGRNTCFLFRARLTQGQTVRKTGKISKEVATRGHFFCLWKKGGAEESLEEVS